MKRKPLFITAAVVLMAAFVVGTLIYQSQTADAAQALAREALLVRAYAPTAGAAEAKVHVVEFLDPACETCRSFYPFVKRMMAANPGKIRVSVRYAPFHNNSDYVVKVLEATRKQGKYWESLEALLATQATWAPHHSPQPDLVWVALGGLGLDLERVKQDMHAPDIAQIVQQDIADARALNVKQTPEFFVNGKPMPTFGYEQLTALVNDALATAYR
ncbi:MAG TPA: thioredoxin domain-containing protein [Burkholderiales bacterium]|nr:thioredoxin domain-containing protein [Burkholderiales bacterium]